jgi:hypothetical protein
MSLLYECINGIIVGGILEAVEGTAEGEEIARLCIGKLRGMMKIEGDANCKLSLTLFRQYNLSSFRSKICRIACSRQNCTFASTLSRHTGGRDPGVYR